jgi:hypothetical protein
MGSGLRERYPAAANVREQPVRVTRLDSIWPHLRVDGARVLLKSDTQGYEREVLNGAAGCLSKIDGVLMETSVDPIYDGEAPMMELLSFMDAQGFRLAGIEAGSHEKTTGRLLQADCLFLRPQAASRPAAVSRDSAISVA